MNWKREKINDTFKTPAEAYNGALERAVLLIGLHAQEHSPDEVIEIIKSLHTDAPTSEA